MNNENFQAKRRKGKVLQKIVSNLLVSKVTKDHVTTSDTSGQDLAVTVLQNKPHKCIWAVFRKD